MAYDCGEVWRGYTLVKNIIPVDVFEERLPLDLLGISLSGTKAAIGVSSKELQIINAQRPPTEFDVTESTTDGDEPSEG